MNNKKWNNYFINIQNKYNLKMSKNKPIAILLDGKDITKSIKHDLLDESKEGFNDIFEQTIKFISDKFNCIAISGADEVSFVFENSEELRELVPNGKYKAQEIVSLFSQAFYKYFNDRYINSPVYWHCKCLNIPKGKINSYIEYRSSTIYEAALTYFLKRKQKIKNAGRIPTVEKERMCNEVEEYQKYKPFIKGKLYLKGKQVDLKSFLEGKIIELQENERQEKIGFLDLNNFE